MFAPGWGLMERRFTFDAIAERYSAVRPSYPKELLDDVVEESGPLPGRKILEVGCGTGLATRLFAETGSDILALDPGAQMIEAARKGLAGHSNIRFVTTTFEDWQLEPEKFSLVISAQAWHWVAPEVRFAKAAAALVPSGTLAVFGNVEMVTQISQPLEAELEQAYERHAPELLKGKGTHWYLSTGPVESLFMQSGLFGPVIHKTYSWQAEHSAESYAALMGTFSSHSLLSVEVRDALLTDIIAVINARGGRIALPYETHLYMAHKIQRS